MSHPWPVSFVWKIKLWPVTRLREDGAVTDNGITLT